MVKDDDGKIGSMIVLMGVIEPIIPPKTGTELSLFKRELHILPRSSRYRVTLIVLEVIQMTTLTPDCIQNNPVTGTPPL